MRNTTELLLVGININKQIYRATVPCTEYSTGPHHEACQHRMEELCLPWIRVLGQIMKCLEKHGIMKQLFFAFCWRTTPPPTNVSISSLSTSKLVSPSVRIQPLQNQTQRETPNMNRTATSYEPNKMKRNQILK